MARPTEQNKQYENGQNRQIKTETQTAKEFKSCGILGGVKTKTISKVSVKQNLLAEVPSAAL